jgi:hypothetical protein
MGGRGEEAKLMDMKVCKAVPARPSSKGELERR